MTNLRLVSSGVHPLNGRIFRKDFGELITGEDPNQLMKLIAGPLLLMKQQTVDGRSEFIDCKEEPSVANCICFGS